MKNTTLSTHGLPGRKVQIHRQSLKKSDIQGDFDAVCEVIEKRVLEEQQCLSRESIVSVYGINEVTDNSDTD